LELSIIGKFNLMNFDEFIGYVNSNKIKININILILTLRNKYKYINANKYHKNKYSTLWIAF